LVAFRFYVREEDSNIPIFVVIVPHFHRLESPSTLDTLALHVLHHSVHSDYVCVHLFRFVLLLICLHNRVHSVGCYCNLKFSLIESLGDKFFSNIEVKLHGSEYPFVPHRAMFPGYHVRSSLDYLNNYPRSAHRFHVVVKSFFRDVLPRQVEKWVGNTHRGER
ncbi:hypothetical protein PFISCL1PPCAC_3170, partial [Pristionchus fissidentatus]